MTQQHQKIINNNSQRSNNIQNRSNSQWSNNIKTKTGATEMYPTTSRDKTRSKSKWSNSVRIKKGATANVL